MPKKNSGARLEWREDRSVWEIIWYERGQRRRKSTGTSDRRFADSQLAEHIALASRPTDRPRHSHERSIADVLTGYAVEHGPELKGNGQATLGYCIKSLVPFWQGMKVSDITEPTCRAYVAFRGRASVAASTAARELGALSAAVQHDHQQGRLLEVRPVSLPAKPDPKDRWLTRTEAAELIRACRANWQSRGHLPLFVLIGLYTGARKEAILSLRWCQVDFARGLIDLNPPGRERTSKGRPLIPLPRHLATFLRYARRRGTDTGFVLHWRGKPLRNIKKSFAAACDRAGLKDVTPHTLRHTAATWMTMAGVPFPVIARYLGL